MRTKPLALISDLVLVALVVIGAVYLFTTGFYDTGATTDRPLLPLSVDGSRILLLCAFAGIVVGIVVAGMRRGRTRIENGEVTRYSLFDRLVHWGIALG